MDLDRAVGELEDLIAGQRDDGLIPVRPGSDGGCLPLAASIARMVYHAARTRLRLLEGRLARLVEPFDRYHQLLHRRRSGGLVPIGPSDERLLPVPEAEGTDGGPAVLDVAFNSLLVQADSDLADIAIHTGYPTRSMIARRTRLAQALASRLWHQDDGLFLSRRDSGEILPASAESLLPLWSGAALPGQARLLAGRNLRPGAGFWPRFPLSTRPMTAPDFRPSGAASGALCPLLDWLMIRGLLRYGFYEQAAALHETLLGLIASTGIYSSYCCQTGAGVGAGGDPATAALALDMIKTPWDYERW